jgi:hypothetical protein
VHRIVGTWESGGARVAGTWRVTLPVRLQDTTGDVVHHAGLYSFGSLSTAPEPAYSLDVNVPATDDPDLSPQGWQVEVHVRFSATSSETYVIPAPDGGTTDLSDVYLPQTLGDLAPVLIRGVPGGIAELDEDGLVPVDQLPASFGGLAAIVFTQASPLGSWSITHSLGRLPLIHVYVGGSEVLADVDADLTTATVTFASPASGVAVLA